MKKFFLPLIVAMSSFCSCENKKAWPTPADQCDFISYSVHVVPIISRHCAIAGCHVAGFPPGNFTTYEGVHAQIENGFFQLKVLEQRSMPPSDSLNEEELETLQCWVDQGAKDN
ncbi:MAG TPA: hypothetical protein VE978_09005 [Chitinophagales bacterium]|nr:hypothetical protein [Chitinophagales bacterium]